MADGGHGAGNPGLIIILDGSPGKPPFAHSRNSLWDWMLPHSCGWNLYLETTARDLIFSTLYNMHIHQINTNTAQDFKAAAAFAVFIGWSNEGENYAKAVVVVKFALESAHQFLGGKFYWSGWVFPWKHPQTFQERNRMGTHRWTPVLEPRLGIFHLWGFLCCPEESCLLSSLWSHSILFVPCLLL